ncbi:MAG: hypothetical protein HY902_12580 [Deltaproteobacteria bacterium]|nr:hypothetical protein [Deltaproteobacteria bacterium]
MQAPQTLLRIRWSAAALALALAATGCGGSKLAAFLRDDPSLSYSKTCTAQSKSQTERLISGEYVPARLFVEAWPKASAPTEPFIREGRLVAAIESGEVHGVMVLARGGMGKSALVESITGQLCGMVPVFPLDLKGLSATERPVPATILGLLAREVGAAGKPEQQQEMIESMANEPFLLIADHADEVDLPRRAAVMQALADFGKQHPRAVTLLLARPPVLDADYGFAADTKLEIPPLECQATDAFLAKQFKDEEDRAAFSQLLNRYGLDEKARYGVQCMYPSLSTYRDVQVVGEFFRTSRTGESLVSPSAVFEALIGARLHKEFENMRWTQADALDMGDRLLRASNAATGLSNLTFDLAVCEKAMDPRWGDAAVDAGVSGTAADRKRHVCEKTFQSAMFTPAEGGKAYKFSDHSTQELFLARWLNGEIARAGQSCGALDNHRDLIANTGVLKFLAGQPFGRRCLANVVAIGCAKIDAIELTKTLDVGLPVGKARNQILQEAHAAGTSLQPQACVKQVLDDLDRTVSE